MRNGVRLGRFLRTAAWSAVGYVGVFMPVYIFAGEIWRGIRLPGDHSSGGALNMLGAISLLYISMASTLAMSVLAYSAVVALLSYVFYGRRLMLVCAVLAFIVPALSVAFKLSGYFSMLADWPVTVIATIAFGLFCGHMLRSRVVSGET
jgi:hypothetical protein